MDFIHVIDKLKLNRFRNKLCSVKGFHVISPGKTTPFIRLNANMIMIYLMLANLLVSPVFSFLVACEISEMI